MGGLDTSGVVHMPAPGNPGSVGPMAYIMWLDLDSFTQGYVEAMFAGPWEARNVQQRHLAAGKDNSVRVDVLGFRHLSPEALARIMEDCAGIGYGLGKFYANTHRQGGHFWNDRQRGSFHAFPPLTPYLNDEGRVCLREGA